MHLRERRMSLSVHDTLVPTELLRMDKLTGASAQAMPDHRVSYVGETADSGQNMWEGQGASSILSRAADSMDFLQSLLQGDDADKNILMDTSDKNWDDIYKAVQATLQSSQQQGGSQNIHRLLESFLAPDNPPRNIPPGANTSEAYRQSADFGGAYHDSATYVDESLDSQLESTSFATMDGHTYGTNYQMSPKQQFSPNYPTSNNFFAGPNPMRAYSPQAEQGNYRVQSPMGMPFGGQPGTHQSRSHTPVSVPVVKSERQLSPSPVMGPRPPSMNSPSLTSPRLTTPRGPDPGPAMNNHISARSAARAARQRKRREPETDERAQRLQKRMVKNRESAARSRLRRQQYTTELEGKLHELQEQYKRLKYDTVAHGTPNMDKYAGSLDGKALRRTRTSPT